MKTRFWLTILLSLCAIMQIQAIDDLQLHLKVSSLERASSPEFYFGKILFTAKPEENTRHVAIAFAHENYQILHNFQKNQNGLYFYLMDAPDREFLEYRMIIDGIWQADPLSRETVQGINGLRLSQLRIPQNQRPHKPSPTVGPNGLVTFNLNNVPDKLVYLAGDFNQWDPYMLPMEEIEPGLYQARVRLSSGLHFYNYFVDGEIYLDPQNRNIQVNAFGEEVSSLMVP